jgi:uncharacterized repeat protein (TIGR02543 family)
MKSISRLLCMLLCMPLCFSAFSQDACAPVGWATQNGGVTGGGNVTPTIVTTYAQFSAAVTNSSVKVIHVSGTITFPSAGRISFQDQSGKTIFGLPGSKLVSTDLSASGSGILNVKRCSNIIFRNLTFEGPGAYDTDGWDHMVLDQSTNIWVDHCDFQDGVDGNLDVKNQADYVSITWCRFIYLKPPIPDGSGGADDHRFSNLFGSSDGATADRGKLRITMQNCWWAQGCKERMPRVRFGKIHMVNNYFSSAGNNHCIRAGFEADIRVESNYFENVNTPIDLFENDFTAVSSLNNVFVNTSGNSSGSGTAFTPPYSINIVAAANVKANVMAGAGATLSGPSCGGTNYTLSTTASPAEGGTVTGAGSYASGTVVTITATPAAGYSFTGWSGDASGTSTSVNVTMNGNKSVTANFQAVAPTTYTLTTNVSPAAGGTVARNPNAASYNAGTVVALTATPAAGYSFSGWSGDASGTATTVNVTMNANKMVTANFQALQSGSTLRVEESSGFTSGFCALEGTIDNNHTGFTGSGFSNANNAVGAGITWKVSATAGAYQLQWRYANGTTTNRTANLFINGVQVGGSVSFAGTSTWTNWTTTSPTSVNLVSGVNTIVLDGATSNGLANIDWIEINGNNPTAASCNAALTYTLTTSASPAAGGTVSGAGTYNSGSTATVTATPAAGYSFSGWSGDASGTSATVNVTMNANKNVVANFTAIPVTYTLTTSASPAAGGSVSGGGTYNSGSTATVTATPAAGYSFSAWSGDASGTSATVNVTMNANKNVVANFTAIPVTYTLTTSASPAAGGSVSGGGTYNAGSTATVTATPAAGYIFSSWSGDASGTNPGISINMNSNKSVTANFQVSGGTTTIRIEDNATTSQGLCSYEGSVSSNSGASNGKVINLTNSIAKGVNWKVSVPAAGTYTLTWRYVNSSSSNTYSMRLMINGVTINSAQPFPRTSGSTVFATSTSSVNLVAGNNDIRLESTASNATADIDWIEITGSGPAAGNCTAPLMSKNILQTNEETGMAGEVKLYPNPVKSVLNIQFEMPVAGNAHIRIADAYGKTIDDLGSRYFGKGKQQVNYRVKTSNAGAYLVIISSETGLNKTLRFMTVAR